jgi:tetratricopeptide (TPR) repeat protein
MKRQINIRFFILSSVTLIAIGVSAYFAHGYQSRRHADYLVKRGQENEDAGARDLALDYYRKYLAFRPSDGAIRGRVGIILASNAVTLRQKEAAFLTLERALRDDPNLVGVRRKAVQVAIELYRFADARANLEVLLKSSDPDPELMVQNGQCLEEEGRIVEAIAQYREAIDRAPDRVHTYERLAGVLLREKRRPEAIQVMAKLIDNNPHSITARLSRFEFSRGIGDLKTAREDLAAAQSTSNLGDSEADVLLAAADLARVDAEAEPDRAQANQKIAKARSLYARGRKLSAKTIRFVIGAAELELAQRNRSEAVKILREHEAAKTKDISELWAVSTLYIEADETAEAERIIASLTGKIEAAAIDFLTARLKMRRGELSDAVRLLDRCRSEFVHAKDLAFQTEMLLAKCFERLDQSDLRLDACSKATVIDPSSQEARFALAMALAAQGKVEEALGKLQALREENSKYRIPIARTRIAQAREQAAIIAQLQASPELADKVIAAKAQMDQYLAAAASELNGAKELPGYDFVRVDFLLATGKRDDAKKILEEGRMNNPEEVGYWQFLALLAAADGKTADGMAILDEAAKKLGDKIELKLSRIELLIRDKAAAAAYKPFEAGLESLAETDRDRLTFLLIEAYTRSKSQADAERLLDSMAEKRPNDLGVLVRLLEAKLSQDNISDLDSLVDRIRKAEGEDGAIWRFAKAYGLWQLYLKDRVANRVSTIAAKEFLKDAGKRRPKWERIPLLEAQIDDATGETETAIEKYKAAIQLGIRHPDVVRRTVQLLVSRRRIDEARDLLTDSRRSNPKMREELGRPTVEIAMLQDDTSAETVELAERLVKDSKNPNDFVWLGLVYNSNARRVNDGWPQKAEVAFRRAIQIDPTAPEPWIMLVEHLVRLARLDEQAGPRLEQAKGEIEKAEKAIPAEKRSRALATCYDLVGNKAEAEKHYNALVKQSPNDLNVLRSQILFQLQNGETEKAIPSLRRFIDLAPTDSDLRRWGRRALAGAFIASNDFARSGEALDLVDSNLRERQGNPDDLQVRAIVNASRPGSRQQSIKELEDLFARANPSPQMEFVLARLYELDGNWIKAQERMESLLTKGGKRNPAYYSHFIQALLRRDDTTAAARWLTRLESVVRAAQDKANDRTDKSPVIVELRARVWAKQGRKADASRLLKQFAAEVYQERKNPLVLRDVGRLLADLKLTADAEELIRQYVAAAEMKNPTSVLTLAEFLAREDRVAEAIRLCSGALKSANPELTAILAISSVRLGKATPDDYKSAGAVIDEAMRLKPQSLDLQISLAEFHDAEGRYDEAIERYRAILEKDPKSDIALNNLAWLLAFQEGKAAEALEIIERAIRTAGPQANLLDTKGVILISLNRPDEAVKVLAEAVTQARSPELYYHLAMAHYRAKQSVEAGRTWRLAKEAGFTTKNLHPLENKSYEELLKIIPRD